MAPPPPDTKDRIVDLTFVVMLWYLFLSGFSRDPYHLRIDPDLILKNPFLVWTACLTVLYPFRLYTRVVWAAIGPSLTVLLPSLGYQVSVRLALAPGYESEIPVTLLRLIFPTWLITAGMLAVWGAIRMCGFRMIRVGEQSVLRSVGLSELLALTGVFSILVALCRDLFNTKNLQYLWYSPTPVMRYVARPEFADYAAFGVCILVGLSCHPLLASVVVLASHAAVCGLQVYVSWSQEQWHPSHGLVGEWIEVFFLGAPELGFVVTTVVVARWCGYRITRGK